MQFLPCPAKMMGREGLSKGNLQVRFIKTFFLSVLCIKVLSLLKISKRIWLNNSVFPREEYYFPGGQVGLRGTKNSLCVSAAMLPCGILGIL